MQLLKKFALVSFALWCAGCASVKIAATKTWAAPQKDKAAVYFYRESHFQGSALSYNVWENETAPKKLGALKNGSYFYVYLPPGEHTFFVNGEVRDKVTINLKPGETYYYQCRIDMGFWAGRPKLTGVTEASAIDLIKTDLDMTTVDPAIELKKPAEQPKEAGAWPNS